VCGGIEVEGQQNTLSLSVGAVGEDIGVSGADTHLPVRTAHNAALSSNK